MVYAYFPISYRWYENIQNILFLFKYFLYILVSISLLYLSIFFLQFVI